MFFFLDTARRVFQVSTEKYAWRAALYCRRDELRSTSRTVYFCSEGSIDCIGDGMATLSHGAAVTSPHPYRRNIQIQYSLYEGRLQCSRLQHVLHVMLWQLTVGKICAGSGACPHPSSRALPSLGCLHPLGIRTFLLD